MTYKSDFLLPEANPDCVSNKKINEAEKQNRLITFCEHIITKSIIKSTLPQLFVCLNLQD